MFCENEKWRQAMPAMIKTKRLELVAFKNKYAEDLYNVWSNFEVIKYTYTPMMKSIEECVEMIRIQSERTNKSFTDRFVILLDNKAIGIAGCVIMNKEKSDFGLYYQLGEQYWGNGYASECAEAIIQYVFANYPQAIIKADAVSVNPASLSVLRKTGFIETGVSENGFNKNGFLLDLVNFELSNRRIS